MSDRLRSLEANLATLEELPAHGDILTSRNGGSPVNREIPPEVSPELRKIIVEERARLAASRERTARRLEEARQEASRIASRLVEADSDVRRIVLFGSVASGRVSNEDFDIDLAVDGGNILTLIGVAEESDFSVDIVDLGNVSDSFREVVSKRGIVLYES